MSRRVMLMAVGAGAVVFLAWFGLLWGPQGGREADADARVEVAAGVNAQLEANVARLEAGRADIPTLQVNLGRLRAAVPDNPDLGQFILDANDAATASGVNFVSISPTPPAANVDPLLPAAVGLGINVNGGYFQVRDYLNRINDLTRLVVIDTVALTPSASDTGTPNLSASIAARMFTATVPVTEAAGAAPTSPVSAVPTSDTGVVATVPVTTTVVVGP